MSRYELRRRLDRAGRRPVPAPRTVFAEKLERRLRAAHAASGATRARNAGAWGSAGPGLRARIAAAAALLLVGLVAGLGVGVTIERDEAQALRLLSAREATVELPDGTVLVARGGQVLEEGSVVRTGPRGRVTTALQELRPDQAAVVRDGALTPVPASEERAEARPSPGPVAPTPEPRRPAAPSPSPERTAATQPSRSPSPSPARPSPSPSPEVAVRPSPSPSPEAAARPSPSPSPERPSPSPSPSPAPAPQRPSPSPSPAPEGTASPSPAAELRLSAGWRDGFVRLEWSAVEDPRLAGYVVLRAEEPHRPVWPADEHTVVVTRVAAGSPTAARDAPGTGEWVYRVVAVDAEGRALAASPAVTAARG